MSIRSTARRARGSVGGSALALIISYAIWDSSTSRAIIPSYLLTSSLTMRRDKKGKILRQNCWRRPAAELAKYGSLPSSHNILSKLACREWASNARCRYYRLPRLVSGKSVIFFLLYGCSNVKIVHSSCGGAASTLNMPFINVEPTEFPLNAFILSISIYINKIFLLTKITKNFTNKKKREWRAVTKNAKQFMLRREHKTLFFFNRREDW